MAAAQPHASRSDFLEAPAHILRLVRYTCGRRTRLRAAPRHRSSYNTTAASAASGIQRDAPERPKRRKLTLSMKRLKRRINAGLLKWRAERRLEKEWANRSSSSALPATDLAAPENGTSQALQGSSLKAKEPFTFSTELIKLDPESPNHDNLNSEFGRGSSPLRTPKVEILSDVEDATPQQELETDPIDIESAENRLNSNEIEMDPIDSFFTAMATSVKTLPTILQVQVKQKVAAAVFEAESAFISGKF